MNHSGAGDVTCFGQASSDKAVKDPLLVFRRNARAGITRGDRHPTPPSNPPPWPTHQATPAGTKKRTSGR